uniref:Salivary lipocalin n=1 Tax=Triatoma brasiliensis TaxID=65344 RepID=A0MK90_TRIBS|nr:salivary lipocalin [Triatoma brasiliensis]
MKINAVIFGILTYTVTKKQPVETCQNRLPIKSGLKITEFFTGTWFTTHMKDASDLASCREYKFQQNPQGILLTYTGQVPDSNKPYAVTCSSNGTVVSLNASAPIPFNCVQKYTTAYHAPGKEFSSLGFSVIETDYTEYGFLYRCTQFNGEQNSYGIYILLHRSKTGDGSKANDILKKSGMDLPKFKKYSC